MKPRLSISPRLRWSLVILSAAAIAIGLPGGVPSAQQPGLQLGIALTDSLVSSGETLTMRVHVANPGGSGAADFYFAILLPDGATIVSAGPGIGARFGRFADLGTLVPVATGIGLGAPFDYHTDAFFTYTFNGSEPAGTYRVYFAALTAGALRDGAIAGGELIALATSEFSVSAPVTAVVDPSRAATGVIQPSGGQVTTTSSAGIGFTLSVPPGAVPAATTIAIAPLVSVSNLPGAATFAFGLRAEPSGLAFDVPATLSMTVPTGMPLSSRGYAALVTSEQGRRLDLVPVAVTDRTLTVTVPHFSDVVITGDVQLYCQPAVTTEMATACALIAAALNLAGSIEDPTFKDYVLQVALPDWYEAGIRGRMSRLTDDEPGPGGNIDALLDVTFSEWLAWAAFYEMAAGPIVITDSTRPLATLIQDAFGGLTFGTQFGQQRANTRCLADRPNAATYVGRVWTLDTYFRGAFHETPAFDTEYCLRVAIDAAPPPVLTPGTGTTMPVDVRLRFTDNVEATGLAVQALLTITATSATVTPAGGIVTLPLAQNVTVTPTATSSVITITASVAEPVPLSYLPPITRAFNAGESGVNLVVTQSLVRAVAEMELPGWSTVWRIVDARTVFAPSQTALAEQPSTSVTVAHGTFTGSNRTTTLRTVSSAGNQTVVSGSGRMAPTLAIDPIFIGTVSRVAESRGSGNHSVCFDLPGPFEATYSTQTTAPGPTLPNGTSVATLTVDSVSVNPPASGTLALAAGERCITFATAFWRCSNRAQWSEAECPVPTPLDWSYTVTLRRLP